MVFVSLTSGTLTGKFVLSASLLFARSIVSSVLCAPFFTSYLSFLTVFATVRYTSIAGASTVGGFSGLTILIAGSSSAAAAPSACGSLLATAVGAAVSVVLVASPV